METLSNSIVTEQGEIIVTTLTRRLFIFKQPRTTIMPNGFSKFGRRFGFEVIYNTDEELVLREFHDFFIKMISNGEFEMMLANAKSGFIEIPLWFDHINNLKSYIAGFKA
ncbi:MAG: hypothetical protein WDM76_08490 [Limisphaerales bacterium]